MTNRPVHLEVVGQELAIKWPDGHEAFIGFEPLRRACPCAVCQGEVDVMGRLHRGPERKLTDASYVLRGMEPVGSYGVQPVWADGHNTGLYTFDYLRKLADRLDKQGGTTDSASAKE